MRVHSLIDQLEYENVCIYLNFAQNLSVYKQTNVLPSNNTYQTGCSIVARFSSMVPSATVQSITGTFVQPPN